MRATRTNGCYAWMIWVNARKPCVGPRVGERPVDDAREFPELPADMYHYAGLFGQLVAVFPSQGVIVVRTGQEADAGGFTGGSDYQNELFKRVLGAITDQRIVPPGDARDAGKVSREDVDGGFHTAVFEPEQYTGGFFTPPLPAAGPERARAVILEQVSRRVKAGWKVPVRVACPRLAESPCRGTVRMRGAGLKELDLAPGAVRILRFRLRQSARPAPGHRLRTRVFARNPDSTGSTPSNLPLPVAPCSPPPEGDPVPLGRSMRTPDALRRDRHRLQHDQAARRRAGRWAAEEGDGAARLHPDQQGLWARTARSSRRRSHEVAEVVATQVRLAEELGAEMIKPVATAAIREAKQPRRGVRRRSPRSPASRSRS